MTDDERLAAIRARSDANVQGHADYADAVDIPWLLDRLAEVTAERDRLDNENARLNGQTVSLDVVDGDVYRRLVAERDEYQDKALCADVDAEVAWDRATKAEAALARVEGLCDRWETVETHPSGSFIREIRAALAGE